MEQIIETFRVLFVLMPEILEQIVEFVAVPELQAMELIQEQRVQTVLKTVEIPACVTSL